VLGLLSLAFLNQKLTGKRLHINWFKAASRQAEKNLISSALEATKYYVSCGRLL
jgi:hypothetical protein